QADAFALSDFGDIADPQRRAVLCVDHGVGDVIHAGDEAQRPDIDLLHAGFHEATARIDVVIRQLLLHLADIESVGDQLFGIDAYLILARSAAEAADINNIRNRL